MKPVKDPFATPVQAKMPEGDPLAVALQGLLRQHGVGPDKLPLVSTRTDTPAAVIGAEPLLSCIACGEKVWVAPSSQQMLDKVVAVCVGCFMHALAN